MNAGGPAYIDPQGRFWAASNGFTLLPAGTPSPFSFTPPAGSNIPVIYQTGLGNNNGTIQYVANVPNGNYQVTLKFADSLNSSDIFDVTINGATVLSHNTVWATAGKYNPWDATFPVTATDGKITVVLKSVSWFVIINAIEILPANFLEVLPRNPSLDIATIHAVHRQCTGNIQPGRDLVH